MRKITLLCLALATVCVSLAASASGGSLRREIIGQSSNGAIVVSVELDSHIFNHTQTGWADLRVIERESGSEVPRLVEPLRSFEQISNDVRRSVVIRQIEQLPEGGLSASCRCAGDRNDSLRALTIETPLTDYEQSVQVLLQDESGIWQSHGPVQLIYDYSRYADVRKNRIDFPAFTNKNFKLVFGKADDQLFSRQLTITEEHDATATKEREIKRYQVEERPFRIDRIIGYDKKLSMAQGQIMTTELPLPQFSSKTSSRKGETHLTIDTCRWPLVALRVAPVQQNFERSVILAKPAATGWETITRGKISQIRLPGMAGHDARTIAFGETRADKLRLTIENHDNPPLTFKPESLSARRIRYQMLFIAEPGCEYSLCYRHPEPQPMPRYEENILLYLREGRSAVTWKLGAAPSVSAVSLWLRLRYFVVGHAMLLASLAIMVVLALLLVQAARKMKTATPGDAV